MSFITKLATVLAYNTNTYYNTEMGVRLRNFKISMTIFYNYSCAAAIQMFQDVLQDVYIAGI